MFPSRERFLCCQYLAPSQQACSSNAGQGDMNINGHISFVCGCASSRGRTHQAPMSQSALCSVLRGDSNSLELLEPHLGRLGGLTPPTPGAPGVHPASNPRPPGGEPLPAPGVHVGVRLPPPSALGLLGVEGCPLPQVLGLLGGPCPPRPWGSWGQGYRPPSWGSWGRGEGRPLPSGPGAPGKGATAPLLLGL